MTTTFTGGAFLPNSDWYIDEQKLIENIRNQIDSAFPNGQNLFVNTTWIGPKFNNGRNWKNYKSIISQQKFDRIFFNMPYPHVFVPLHGQSGGKVSQELVRDFFVSAEKHLTFNGKMIVLLRITQFKTWRVALQAKYANLILEDVIPFDEKEYKGYETVFGDSRQLSPKTKRTLPVKPSAFFIFSTKDGLHDIFSVVTSNTQNLVGIQVSTLNQMLTL